MAAMGAALTEALTSTLAQMQAAQARRDAALQEHNALLTAALARGTPPASTPEQLQELRGGVSAGAAFPTLNQERIHSFRRFFLPRYYSRPSKPTWSGASSPKQPIHTERLRKLHHPPWLLRYCHSLWRVPICFVYTGK